MKDHNKKISDDDQACEISHFHSQFHDSDWMAKAYDDAAHKVLIPLLSTGFLPK
jgi:hypothetical protein